MAHGFGAKGVCRVVCAKIARFSFDLTTQRVVKAFSSIENIYEVNVCQHVSRVGTQKNDREC